MGVACCRAPAHVRRRCRRPGGSDGMATEGASWWWSGECALRPGLALACYRAWQPCDGTHVPRVRRRAEAPLQQHEGVAIESAPARFWAQGCDHDNLEWMGGSTCMRVGNRESVRGWGSGGPRCRGSRRGRMQRRRPSHPPCTAKDPLRSPSGCKSRDCARAQHTRAHTERTATLINPALRSSRHTERHTCT